MLLTFTQLSLRTRLRRPSRTPPHGRSTPQAMQLSRRGE